MNKKDKIADFLNTYFLVVVLMEGGGGRQKKITQVTKMWVILAETSPYS